MNFAELAAEVQALVKRPDRAEAVESAIKSAIIKAHHSDFFYKDLREVAVQFDEARHIQSFIPSQVFPNYRAAKYIRFWEGDVDGTPLRFLQHIGIEAALDSYGYTKQDVFYLSGQRLQLNTCVPIQRCLFGAYVNPVVTPGSLDSWIAQEFPYAIIYEAARIVFMGIAFQEQARGMQALVNEEYGALAISNVDTIVT